MKIVVFVSATVIKKSLKHKDDVLKEFYILLIFNDNTVLAFYFDWLVVRCTFSLYLIQKQIEKSLNFF